MKSASIKNLATGRNSELIINIQTSISEIADFNVQDQFTSLLLR